MLAIRVPERRRPMREESDGNLVDRLRLIEVRLLYTRMEADQADALEAEAQQIRSVLGHAVQPV